MIEGEQIRYLKRLHYWHARACQRSEPDSFFSPFQPVKEKIVVEEEDREVVVLRGERPHGWTPDDPIR